MTPSEFLRIKEAQEEIIEACQRKISTARKLADKATMPETARPARAGDIRKGVIVWHKQAPKYGGDFWNIVDEPLRYGDPFKAYVADDGCRYGIQDAYIED